MLRGGYGRRYACPVLPIDPVGKGDGEEKRLARGGERGGGGDVADV